jgi:hypothetical protein
MGSESATDTLACAAGAGVAALEAGAGGFAGSASVLLGVDFDLA